MKKVVTLILCVFSMQGLASDVYKTVLTSVDAFEKIFGVVEGKRRNHTKGFCFEGEFIPNSQEMSEYSVSVLFSEKSDIVGRLSHKGGNAHAADNKPGEYGMGLSFTSSSGELNRMSMNTLDFFPVATLEEFAKLMQAKSQGTEAVKVFKESNKDFQHFKKYMMNKKKELRPYEGSQFNSINSFYLVNTKGKKIAVRWSFIPSQDQLIVTQPSENFFLENIQNNLKKKEGVSWDMSIIIANEKDIIDNAAVQWKGKHKTVLGGKLIIQSVSTELQGQCEDMNYDPLMLSKGVEPSADPILQARRLVYAIASGRRAAEKQKMTNIESQK